MIKKIMFVLMLIFIAGCSGDLTGSVALGDTKTFVVTGENFKFVIDGNDNPNMLVNKGDIVRVEFTSISGFHDWVVDEFGATAQVNAGGSTFVEFVADKSGEFSYYCSVGSHRERGMVGKFIVQ